VRQVQNKDDNAASVPQKTDTSSTTTKVDTPQSTSTPAPTQTSTQVPSEPFWNIKAKDVLHDTVALVSACAWPVVGLIFLLLMRKQIKSLSNRLIKWSGLGVDAEFQEGLQQIEKIKERDDSYQEKKIITADGYGPIIEQRGPVPQLTHDTVSPESASESPKANEVKQIDIETTVRFADGTSAAKQKESPTERIQRLVQVSPAAAVTEAYSYLERQAQLTGTALGIAPPTVRNVVKHLVGKGRLPDSTTEMAKRLQTLRNHAAQSRTEGIQVTDALEYWTLTRDLMEQLATVWKPSDYKIVYKGGPNDGIIETGEDASRTITLLGSRMISENRIVIGPPKIGRGMKGMSHFLLFSIYYQHLTHEECIEIYKAAGFDLMQVFSGVHYHCEDVINDIVVMKYYPKGVPCPCEPPKAPKKEGEGDMNQKETPPTS
jgi:hypothetical protein